MTIHAHTPDEHGYCIACGEAHDEVVEALEKLANEASGFLSMADRATHGNTNMAVLRTRIDQARAVLAKAKESR